MKSFHSFSLVVAVVLALCASLSLGGKQVDGQIQRQDLEYIKCDVCHRVSAELINAIEAGRKKAPKNVIGEFQIVEIMDNVCKSKNLTTGAWTRQIDIVEIVNESGKKILELSEPGGKQSCNRECATLSKSCDSLLEGEIDADDFSAYLYRSRPTVEQLQEKLCKKLTKRCVGTKKALPVDHKRTDEPFVPMDETASKMEELSAMMKEAGVGGSLRSREDMADMLDEYNDDSEEDSYANMKRNFAPPGYAKNSHEKDDEF